jgi:hypothetical protein
LLLLQKRLEPLGFAPLHPIPHPPIEVNRYVGILARGFSSLNVFLKKDWFCVLKCFSFYVYNTLLMFHFWFFFHCL